jgi:hypothetical protein
MNNRQFLKTINFFNNYSSVPVEGIYKSTPSDLNKHNFTGIYEESRQKRYRSIQTIRDCTEILEEFKSYNLPYTIQVRRLTVRTEKNSQHFVITLKETIIGDCCSVKPLGEGRVIRDMFRFTVKPNKQYPEITLPQQDLDKIISVIKDFLSKF